MCKELFGIINLTVLNTFLYCFLDTVKVKVFLFNKLNIMYISFSAFKQLYTEEDFKNLKYEHGVFYNNRFIQ